MSDEPDAIELAGRELADAALDLVGLKKIHRVAKTAPALLLALLRHNNTAALKRADDELPVQVFDHIDGAELKHQVPDIDSRLEELLEGAERPERIVSDVAVLVNRWRTLLRNLTGQRMHDIAGAVLRGSLTPKAIEDARTLRMLEALHGLDAEDIRYLMGWGVGVSADPGTFDLLAVRRLIEKGLMRGAIDVDGSVIKAHGLDPTELGLMLRKTLEEELKDR